MMRRACLLLFLLTASAGPRAQAPPPPPGSPPAPSGAGAGGLAGGLLVAPTRLVFEGRARTAELTLLNSGAQATTYRIAFTQLRMGERGEMREITEPGPGEQFADRLIRYSPRQVVLSPGVPQTIRLQVRKPAELPPGEYRSHLAFHAVPRAEEEPGAPPAPERGLDVRIQIRYGVSIPVIVRHGETSATVGIAGLSVGEGTEGGRVAKLRLERVGTRSVFGDLTATFTPPSGRRVVVGLMKGLAVYVPNASRQVEIPLNPPPGVVLGKGRLEVTYASAGVPEEQLAAAEIALD